MSVGLAFTTGLVAGGASCAAVQGGLLASSVAQRRPRAAPKSAARRKRPRVAAREPRPSLAADTTPVAGFLAGKLAAHLVLGALLGAVGAAAQPGYRTRAALLITAGALMVGFGLSLLGVLPRLQVSPPPGLARWLRAQSKRGGWRGPAVLGLATVLLPCGVTLSMELLAATSGSPLEGAAIMGAFVLGTVPLFALLGYALRRSARFWHGHLARVAAVLVIVSGLISLNSGLVLAGSPVTPARAWHALTLRDRPSAETQEGLFDVPVATRLPDGGQSVEITVHNTSYQPSRISATAGLPTVLRLRTNRTRGCTRAFVIPSLGVEEVLPETGDSAIDLGVLKPGTLKYTCGMGMYHGTIEVRA